MGYDIEKGFSTNNELILLVNKKKNKKKTKKIKKRQKKYQKKDKTRERKWGDHSKWWRVQHGAGISP